MVVVNPRQVRDFAKATGKLAKTDSLDAAVLAHFAGPAACAPSAGRRDPGPQLSGRPQAPGDDHAGLGEEPPEFRHQPAIEDIAWLEGELDDLDEGLRQTLRQSPVWREKDDLLRSVPGVGERLSMTLLAYLPELGTLDRPAGRHPGRQRRRGLPSTGTAARCGANAPYGADDARVRATTWERW